MMTNLRSTVFMFACETIASHPARLRLCIPRCHLHRPMFNSSTPTRDCSVLSYYRETTQYLYSPAETFGYSRVPVSIAAHAKYPSIFISLKHWAFQSIEILQ